MAQWRATSLATKQKQTMREFLNSDRCVSQKFWEGEAKDLQDIDSLRVLMDEVLSAQTAEAFLKLKAEWQQAEKIAQRVSKAVKLSADDVMRHMKVKSAEVAREKKRKESQAAKTELQKTRKEQQAAAEAKGG